MTFYRTDLHYPLGELVLSGFFSAQIPPRTSALKIPPRYIEGSATPEEFPWGDDIFVYPIFSVALGLGIHNASGTSNKFVRPVVNDNSRIRTRLPNNLSSDKLILSIFEIGTQIASIPCNLIRVQPAFH